MRYALFFIALLVGLYAKAVWELQSVDDELGYCLKLLETGVSVVPVPE